MGETKAWHEDRHAWLVLRQIEAPGADAEKKDEAPLQTESDPMTQLSCRLGDASCAGAIRRAAMTSTPVLPGSILRLQRRYGNQFVQATLPLVAALRLQAADEDEDHPMLPPEFVPTNVARS